jgi:MFS family permease
VTRASDVMVTNQYSAGDRLIRSLTLTTFLQWLGASAILPLLPEFLQRRGGSPALVGAVMAAFFAAGVLTQYPAGRLGDRIGRKKVLLAGLVIYALASAAFLAHLNAGVYVALRALQGVGAGAAEVSSLAMVSGSIALERRGRAFGSIYGGMLAGMAVGPLVGSFVGVGGMGALFIAAGIAALLACLPVLLGAQIAEQDMAERPREALAVRSLLNRSVIGALLTAAALGLTVGVYETCWTLLLELRGAFTWQIGLSWTLFAVPFVAMARPGGWLADHLDRRVLVVLSLISSAGFCALYPFLHSIFALVALGAVEAIGVAVALPAAQSLLAQSTPSAHTGRVQGMFSTAETASTAVAAAAGGALFAVVAWAPFVAASVGTLVLCATLPFVWKGVPGRVSEVIGRDPVTALGVEARALSGTGAPRGGPPEAQG